jgi:hypothetical protein
VGLFYFLDIKDMILIKQHLKKSTLTIYFAAGFIFIGTVLFSFINKEVNVIFERPKESGIQTGHSQFHFLVNVTTKKQLVNQL